MSVGAWQRQRLREIAEAIERGHPLQAFERMLVASIVRNHASRIPDEPKKSRGRPPRLDTLLVVIGYVSARRSGASKARAVAEVAENREASTDQIENIVRDNAGLVGVLLAGSGVEGE